MATRSRFVSTVLSAILSCMVFGPVEAETTLNYNSTTQWLSGGSTTYVNAHDDQQCIDWRNSDLGAIFGYQYITVLDVYDGNQDGYMWLCWGLQVTRYGPKVIGQLHSPAGLVYSHTAWHFGEIAQVPYGHSANVNGTWTAFGVHKMLTAFDSCDVMYEFPSFPYPQPIDCIEDFSPFEISLGDSSDYAVVNL